MYIKGSILQFRAGTWYLAVGAGRGAGKVRDLPLLQYSPPPWESRRTRRGLVVVEEIGWFEFESID